MQYKIEENVQSTSGDFIDQVGVIIDYKDKGNGDYRYLVRFTNGDQGWKKEANITKVSTNKNGFMPNIKQLFTSIFTNEPEKSYRKAGFKDDRGIATDEGMRVYVTYLMDNDDTFKASVVDKMIVEMEKDK